MDVKISFEIFPMIIFIGALQGLLCALIALFSGKGRRGANLYFALLISSVSFSVLTFSLYKSNLYLYLPWLVKVSDFLQFLFGPALFLHVKELTGHKREKRVLDLPHFGVALAAFILTVPFFLLDYEGQLKMVELTYRVKNPLLWDLVELFSTLHAVGYILASMIVLKRYRTGLKDNFSSLDKINLLWLKVVLAIMLGAFTLLLFIDSLMFAGVNLFYLITFTTVFGAVTVYAMSFLYFRYISRFSLTISLTAERVNTRYDSSPLTGEELKSYWEKLEAIMREERLYLNKELTLVELANRLDIPRQYLSQVINQEAGLKFYDYVNSYRVEEFIRLSSLPENCNYTILSLAFDAGFNSKSSFNSFFKKDRGMTPSQYIKEVGSS